MKPLRFDRLTREIGLVLISSSLVLGGCSHPCDDRPPEEHAVADQRRPDCRGGRGGGHPNLLRTEFAPPPTGSYVQKPIFSREGANIEVFQSGRLRLATSGPYEGPSVYQDFAELPSFDGKRPCIGSWIVNGWACGAGIREDDSIITGNLSRFVPHLFRAG